MAILNNLTNIVLDDEKKIFIDVLKDIVNKVRIESSFCFSHLDYKADNIPVETVDNWQKMPLEYQKKCLKLRLQSFLHKVYYNGSFQTTHIDDDPEKNLPSASLVENNTINGLNREFYEQLHEHNAGTGYFDFDWSVVAEKDHHIMVVHKNGLTLHIEREYHLKSSQVNAQVGDNVAILIPHNILQDKAYIAISNQGLVNYDNQVVNIYFHIKSEGVLPLMAGFTQQLNLLEIPFTFKVPCDPADYNIYDSGVLQIEKTNYSVVEPILKKIYHQEWENFDSEIPFLTKFIAPGLAVAEEPKSATKTLTSYQENFGMHRTQAIADGLCAAWEKGKESPQQRMNSILEQFSLRGIELERPYLEADSQDIYRRI